MAIQCKKCGHEMKEYKAVSYDVDFLEDLISAHFRVPFFDMVNNNLKTKKQSIRRHVCVALVYRFSSLTGEQVNNRYGTRGEAARYYHGFIQETANNEDFDKLRRMLSDGELLNKNSKNFAA